MVLPDISRVLHLVLVPVPNCINVRATVRRYTFASFAQTLKRNQASLWFLREGRTHARLYDLRIKGFPDNFLVRVGQSRPPIDC
jgi:hypothetical protein